MVRRRVRAMLVRSVLMPVAISRAVFGHKNTNSPMSFLRRGPEHCSFGRLWEHAAANESCGKLWKSVDISFEAIAAAHLFVGGASASAPIQCSPKYAAMSRASCPEIPLPGILGLGIEAARIDNPAHVAGNAKFLARHAHAWEFAMNAPEHRIVEANG